MIIAGHYVIPEVTVCFGRKLFRGNRTTKMNAEGFRAFDSPNALPLATFGIEIEALSFMLEELGKTVVVTGSQ
ncbi:hypothetical protein J437_LFUL019683, partial [Ladona fulva]